MNNSKRIPRSQTFKLSDQALSQEVSGETVLLDLASEQYFGLDAVGTRIWQLLKEGGVFEVIVQVITDEFEVAQEKVEQDLEELLLQLADAGLLSFAATGSD